MKARRIVHLVDDMTAGGVMRVLDHIVTAPEMAATGQHSLCHVARGSLGPGRIPADIIVSHLSVSWRNLPLMASLRALHPFTPLVHVEHSYTDAFCSLNVVAKHRFAALLLLAYGLFDRVVAVSEGQGAWLRRFLRRDALHVIPSCVDLASFRALPRKDHPVQVIGAIGRLDRQKGFDTLITAMRRRPDLNLQLHIYGTGADENALRLLAENDPRIRFMGFANDPVAAMKAVDAVAMPSRWEAYGLVAIEALSAGRILLVNDLDGLQDHLSHGAHPVAEPSVEAWETALGQLAQGRYTMPAAAGTPAFEQSFAHDWQDLIDSVGKRLVRGNRLEAQGSISSS
ncbi:glycosyltransferase [Seohaeicola saemankumensis]|uniref:Glycosyltransferase n=1 Tax=Seohaeicola saemankumensis TaxID=481181 RepID=A0ABW3TF95_9RHOB